MNLKVAADLQDYVDGELSWRKQELTSHRFLLQQVRERKHQQKLLLRTGVCLLYAHWEGFAKNSATKYLDYVGQLGLKIGDLSENLIAACLRGSIRESGMSKKPLLHTELVLRLRGTLREPARFSGDGLVDTESNLNSEVLRNLSCLLGIDYRAFESKAALLDEKLLKNRNDIAHGQYLAVDMEDYELLHGEIIGMMSEFGDRLVNAASLRSFLRTPSP